MGTCKDAQHQKSSGKCKSNQGEMSPVKMAIIQKSINNTCWQGCGEKETLVHWLECKLVKPLWKTVWSFLKKKVKLPYDS